MPEQIYKIGAVASLLGVHINTVRLWVDEFAIYMEDTAKPPMGGTRRFTERDVATLQRVRELRKEKRSIAEIQAALADMLPSDMHAQVIDAPLPLTATQTRPEGQEHALALVQDLAAQIQPLLSDAFERGRELGIAQGRRKVPPEYVLIVALVAMAAMVIIATIINK